MHQRRRLLAGAAAGLAVRAASAQPAWPEKPIRCVIGANAGGVSDIFVRLLEPRLRERLGQTFWVDPRPGAGGMVAAELVARAMPDNHTLFVNHIASHGIGPTLYRRLAFDPLADMLPVARLATLPNLLIVGAAHPARSVAELLAWLRANPTRAVFSSAGSGTSSHLGGVMLAQRTGLELTHVPYRGTAPSMTAVLNGEVAFAIDNAPASAQQVRAGLLRALAVSTGTRWSGLPDLPTMQEAGVPDFDVSSWYGLVAPAGSARSPIERLSAEVVEALADPAIVARFREYGADPAPLGPEAYGAFIRAEVAKWAPVVRASGATVD